MAVHRARETHPSVRKPPPRTRSARAPERVVIPTDVSEATLSVGGKEVKLTNLDKLYWKDEGITKRALLQYYADVSPWLLPHIQDRAMTMKRYPGGASGPFFFMKRAPTPRPAWLETCAVGHPSGNVIDYPLIQDLASLLWCVNLGCIDLNPSYGKCGEIDHPEVLHFDLDPGPGVSFEMILDGALALHEALDALHIPNQAKTTGSRGVHIYIPIQKGPDQHQVWEFAKAFGQLMEKREPKLFTTIYKVAARPHGRMLIDFNQNQWGRTLASVYSVRPKPRAPVSMPVTWDEISRGLRIEQFRLDNALERLREKGDLWRPILDGTERFALETFA